MEPEREIESPRFLWVAALTIAASVLLVLAVRIVAIRILHPKSSFAPLGLGPPILDTVVCVIVAIFVFLKVSTYANAVKKWRYLATAVLFNSFVPDILLAKSRTFGGGWPDACALMVMHVAVWIVCISVLPAFAFTCSRVSNAEDTSS